MSALAFSHSAPPPILRITLTEQVLAELRRRIIHAEIPEGAPIPEAQCAEALGVSRVPVREALMQLQKDGLVHPNARGKIVVRTFTRGDCREIPTLRMELEGLAARLAASNHTAKDLAVLRQNIDDFDAATSPEELARLDVEFHQLLCAAAHHHWLKNAWETLRWPFEAVLVRNFRNYVEATSLAESKTSTADHTRILDAIEQRDPATAETLLRQHISRWEEWTPTV